MSKSGLLLLNMGGINSIDEVELFLKNMFNDKNILPMNIYLRKLISYIIIKNRLDEVKKNYQIFGGKSPLTDITQKLIDKLNDKLDISIDMAMRYTPPFAKDALIKMKKDNIDNIILFPMYPQYSTTTTLSSFEDINKILKELDYNPKITLIGEYYDNIKYIEMIYNKIKNAIKGKNSKEYDLILSAHGLPLSIIKNGDPYEKQIEANSSAIKTFLHFKRLEFNNIKLVYQSKVGSSAWLTPSLNYTLRNPTNKKVLIYPISFTIDNAETIFELDIESREIAEKIGYDDFIVASCFNDDDDFVDFIIEQIKTI
jgi:ferrochelatase